LSAAVSPVQPLGSTLAPSSSYIGLLYLGSTVSLVFFAVQLLAFYYAANVLQVRLFRYVAYAQAILFVASSGGKAAAEALTQSAASLVYAVEFLTSGAVSLAAVVGFHRLRGPPGNAGRAHPRHESDASWWDPAIPSSLDLLVPRLPIQAPNLM